MAAGARFIPKYFVARVANAIESAAVRAADAGQASFLERFQDAYKQKLTSVMAITGAAMAPALNPGALTNSAAWEKLVVRLIPRPSSRSIGVGDVVAFNSPFNQHNPHGVMVRRVAALENHPMLSSEEDGVQERIPPGHCWVLADNEGLEPPDVVDSRAFGYLDMGLITGRVIYRVASLDDSGPVANSPQAEAADAAVIEGEVDVAAIAADMPTAADKQQQQQPQQPQKQQPRQASSKQPGAQPQQQSEQQQEP